MRYQGIIKTAGVATLSVVVSLAAVGLANRHEPEVDGTIGTERLSVEALPQSASGTASSAADIAEAVMPSVVGIASGTAIDKRARADRDKNLQWSMGSGIIVTESGYILTNQHVVGSAGNKLLVTFADGSTMDAASVWANDALDLAVIKVNASGLSTAALGDVSSLRVGDSVLAIGNPLSMQFQRTVTGGLISALNRTILVSEEEGTQMYGLIQTDASINPGNSGGPLVNQAGEVVGINTIKVSSAEGIGFAIPINIARPVVEAFRQGKPFHTPYLGVGAQDNAAGKYLGALEETDAGIQVQTVDYGSPAFVAGIRPGDVITHINRKAVNTMIALTEELFQLQSDCKITYISHNSVKEVNVTLARVP